MFLNPLMLLGFGAVAVPVMIHLLNRRKFQRVRWAAMRFLRASVERNRRRMRIEDLLLLLVRCALVALLALLLARPVLKTARASLLGRSAITAVIVIDNSYSMSATDGVNSTFDLARRAAQQVMDSMPGGSSVAVWTCSDDVRQLIPEPTMEMNLARSAIRDATVSDRGSDVLPAIRAAAELLRRRAGSNKEICLITDGQQSSWKHLPDIARLLHDAKDDVKLRVILAARGTQGSGDARNLCVADLIQASGIAAADRPIRFAVEVRNTGAVEARDVRVALFVDASPAAKDASPVVDGVIDLIEPGKSKTISLFARLAGEGWHSITASIDHDRLPADDSRTIAVRAVEKVNVLLVDGDPGKGEARDAETFFLRNALVPVPPAEQEQYFVHATTISPPDLPSQNFDDFDAIVLANVADIPRGTAENLAAYLSRGGGLIVFPGDHTSVAFYNDELFARLQILPARLGDPKGEAGAERKLLALQDKNFEHPIAAIWNDPASGSPSSASFYRIFPIGGPASDFGQVNRGSGGFPSGRPTSQASSTQPRDNTRIVMRFSDNSAAIVERAVGRGRSILFASTADTAWNDLPVKPGIFVPLIYRALGSIVQRSDEQMNLLAGQPFSYAAPADLLGRDAIVATPLDAPGKSKQSRRVELVNRQPTLTFDDTDVAGAYDVKIADNPPTKFAVAFDPVESNVDRLGEDQLKQLADAPADIMELDKTPSLAAAIEQRRVGKELWFPLAVTAIVLAASETLLASWFSRTK